MQKTNVLRYESFRGVDMSTEGSNVDPRRSPLGENMIADRAGFPEKRPGWRILYRMGARTNGLFYARFADGTESLFCHAGTALFAFELPETGFEKQPVRVLEGLNDTKSGCFTHRGRLFLLDGAEYRCITHGPAGYASVPVTEIATVPTVRRQITGNAVTAQADGSFLGGHTFVYGDPPNVLTQKRKVLLVGDGTSRYFYLGEEAVVSIDAVTVNGAALTPGTDVTCDLASGKLTFAVAPEPHPDGAGYENVEVCYTAGPAEPEYAAARINACTACDLFGAFNDNRVFVTGEADGSYRNLDHMSAADDPCYFPVTGTVRVGADTGRVLGYLKQFDGQLVIKEENGQDAAVFLRTAERQTDGTVLFPLRQGARTPGCTGPGAMGVYRGEPLFLTDEGLFGVVSGAVRYERAVAERSMLVDGSLNKEPQKREAVCASWNGLFLTALNGHVYVMDGRRGEGAADADWYYWTNVPVRTFFAHGGRLFFGTEAGGICLFNTDTEQMSRFSDGAYPTVLPEEMTEEQAARYASLSGGAKRAYRESLIPGAAIEAVWATRAETFGDITRYKNIPKRGCAVRIKPYTRSSVEIAARTDRDGLTLIRERKADILDFSDIDFERFTFRTTDAPVTVPIGRKFKKCTMLQLIFKNTALNEGFGVYGIEIAYAPGNAIK